MENNLLNLKFGRLTVVEKMKEKYRRNTIWLCQCDCGNFTKVPSGRLKSGHTKSCGCLKQNYLNMEGKIFGKLTVIKLYDRVNSEYRYLCGCECGNETIVKYGNLFSGNTKSCGCLRLEGLSNLKHGGRNIREYLILAGIKARCLNPNDPAFSNYGGRGIVMCDRWHSFENFLEDMGLCPSPEYSIDRIDNNGDYCKENCRWATSKEQNRNRRDNLIIEYMGICKCLAEWCEILELRYKTVFARLKYLGWSIERAFEYKVLKES